MKEKFRAVVWKEGDIYIAQCLDVDIASQGENKREALSNLGEALALHFEEPQATDIPKIDEIEVDIGAA